MRLASGLALVLAATLLAVAAPAQCVDLGIPGSTGCGPSGPSVTPTLTCNGAPTVGNANFSLTAATGCLFANPILLLGTCASPPVAIPGPFGTNAFCSAGSGGCIAYVGPTIFVAMPGSPGAVAVFYDLPIPNDPGLAGANVCLQEVHGCVLFVGSCISITNGLSITIQ